MGGSRDQQVDEVRLAAAIHWYAEGRLSRERAEAMAGADASRFAAALTRRDRLLGEIGPEPRSGYVMALLGRPTIHRLDGGRPVELEWTLHKALETVAFLALTPGNRATKEEIVEAVWWDAGHEAVAKNFHPTLSHVRRSLGDRAALVLRNGAYVLAPEVGWDIDTVRFDQLASAGHELIDGPLPEEPSREISDHWPAVDSTVGERALALWSEAWKLYRGPVMAGRDSPWIDPYREVFREAYLRLLADIGRVAELLGRQTLALDAYRSVLIEEPYDERIHLRMMTLYSRQGRRDLLRRQYVRLQELLRRELGEEPREETQERYHRLMGK